MWFIDHYIFIGGTMNEIEYKKLYEAAPIGLWRTNIEDGRVIHANEATVKILGFDSFEELSQYDTTNLYDLKIRTELVQELKECHEIKDFQIVMRRKDGKEITVSLSVKIDQNNGYIEGTIKDVTNIISFESSVLLPHLEKISLLKQHIIEKLRQSDYSYHELRKSSKIA